MKKLVVTSARENEPMLRYTEPLMRSYATKVGADFTIIKGRKLRHPVCPMLEKYRVYDLFDKYDRILYLDADVLVHPSAPDVFKAVPVDEIGAVFDNEKNDERIVGRVREAGIKVVANALGDINWKEGDIEGYINTGVIVASKVHRDVFKYDRRIDKINQRILLEQNLTNYNINKLKFKIHKLDRNFNRIAFGGKEEKFFENGKFPYFLHFAGKSGRNELAKKYSERYKRGETSSKDHITGWIEKNIPGALSSPKEGELLYELAAKCKQNGIIVEIGSLLGKSTAYLAFGSKASQKSKVYAIDPFNGGNSHPKSSFVRNIIQGGNYFHTFLENIKKAGLLDIVKPIPKRSIEAIRDIKEPIKLLFIDGAHSYEHVKQDFTTYFPKVIQGGIVAFHDRNRDGVKELIAEVLGHNLLRNIHTFQTILYGEKI